MTQDVLPRKLEMTVENLALFVGLRMLLPKVDHGDVEQFRRAMNAYPALAHEWPVVPPRDPAREARALPPDPFPLRNILSEQDLETV